jgi:hypothetical protein
MNAYSRQTEQLRCFDPAVAGDDHARIIYRHRIGEAEAFNSVSDLGDLLLALARLVMSIMPFTKASSAAGVRRGLLTAAPASWRAPSCFDSGGTTISILPHHNRRPKPLTGTGDGQAVERSQR